MWRPLPGSYLEEAAPLELHRYLVPFDAREAPAYRFDVVIVGGGAAGGMAALAAADRGASVAVLAKGELRESNTNQALGGVAAVLSSADSFAVHAADTLRVGLGLAEKSVVEAVVRAGPLAIQELLELGADLDRASDGGFELSKEGGHTHPRIVHAQGDSTGLEIQRTLSSALERHPRISCFTHLFAIDVLTEGAGEERTAAGVLCRTQRGERVAFGAGQLVMATGGAGQIWRETTNPAIATGDGLAMGLRAGAIVRDLEFVQFHPTCLYIAGAARVLISEVVRGAGGVLRDRHGVRFMPQYHPQAELAPRDVVSRAVFARMVATDDTSVYLDLSDVDTDPHLAFPGISRICRFFGIDIARDPIPVLPGAHYIIGGLLVDLDGQTTLPGLWAVGECASTGLHGANRMGSNSLLEALVLGRRCGARAAGRALSSAAKVLSGTGGGEGPRPPAGVEVNIEDLTYSLKSMMWRQMGVERAGAGMEDALDKLRFWNRAVRELGSSDPRTWELLNMLTVSQVATLAAIAREESRGVHYRTDFDLTRPEWHVHTAVVPVWTGSRVRAVRLVRQPVGEPLIAR